MRDDGIKSLQALQVGQVFRIIKKNRTGSLREQREDIRFQLAKISNLHSVHFCASTQLM